VCYKTLLIITRPILNQTLPNITVPYQAYTLLYFTYQHGTKHLLNQNGFFQSFGGLSNPLYGLKLLTRINSFRNDSSIGFPNP